MIKAKLLQEEDTKNIDFDNVPLKEVSGMGINPDQDIPEKEDLLELIHQTNKDNHTILQENDRLRKEEESEYERLQREKEEELRQEQNRLRFEEEQRQKAERLRLEQEEEERRRQEEERKRKKSLLYKIKYFFMIENFNFSPKYLVIHFLCINIMALGLAIFINPYVAEIFGL